MATVIGLVNTSADDCRISLQYVTDLDLLHEVLGRCIDLGQTTKIKHVRSRINQLEKRT